MDPVTADPPTLTVVPIQQQLGMACNAWHWQRRSHSMTQLIKANVNELNLTSFPSCIFLCNYCKQQYNCGYNIHNSGPEQQQNVWRFRTSTSLLASTQRIPSLTKSRVTSVGFWAENLAQRLCYLSLPDNDDKYSTLRARLTLVSWAPRLRYPAQNSTHWK